MKFFLALLFTLHSFVSLCQSTLDKEVESSVNKIKPIFKLSSRERGEWLKKDFLKLGKDIKNFTNEGYVVEGSAATLHYGDLANLLHMNDIYSLTREEFGAIAGIMIGLRVNMDQVRKGKMQVVNGKFVEVNKSIR